MGNELWSYQTPTVWSTRAGQKSQHIKNVPNVVHLICAGSQIPGRMVAIGDLN